MVDGDGRSRFSALAGAVAPPPLRSPATGFAGGALCVAPHRPNLTAHIDELESISRQLAEGFPIAGQNRSHCAVRRIFDFVAIGQIEMPHGISDKLVVLDNVANFIEAIGRTIQRRVELHRMGCSDFG